MSELFVSCPPYLESLLVRELEQLGIKGAKRGSLGVFVPQSMEAVYTINYCSRIATRVLWPLAKFPCKDKEELYRFAKKIDWTSCLHLDKTFAIDANVTHPNLRNSLFASFVVKDAICDQFREKTGARPSIDVANPDVQLNLFIEKGYAIISLDTSGIPLYKRGWRKEAMQAPLQESIAAAILQMAGFSKEKTLYDPCCGSGTILIEAAMIATDTPAGYFRDFWGFFHMREFQKEVWQKIKNSQDAKKTDLAKGLIAGSDKDPRAINLCKMHLEKTGFGQVEVMTKDVRHLPMRDSSRDNSRGNSIVVCNPPYGKRLQASADVYPQLGEFLKKTGATGYILAPGFEHIRPTQQAVKRKFPLMSGGFEVTLFELKG